MIMRTSRRSGKVEPSGISGAFPDCLAVTKPLDVGANRLHQRFDQAAYCVDLTTFE
jgi:hypothetical protein